jgi:flagellar protein FlaG
MDGIANVARQQQSQVSPQETQSKNTEQAQLHVQKSTQSNNEDLIRKSQRTQQQQQTTNTELSQRDVQELVKKINEAMAPLNPDIKFGVDQNDIFYVAAIDTKTNRIIRRFPAEQAQDFLPKMQEVSGILFDSKG